MIPLTCRAKNGAMNEHNPKLITVIETFLPIDSLNNAVRLTQTRWLVGSAIILATALSVNAPKINLPEWWLYLLGVFVLGYNVVLAIIQRTQVADPRLHPRRLRWLLNAHILLDWLSIGVFLHLTGGVTSPAIVFFFIHVVLVTIVLPDQSSLIHAFIAIGIVILVALLEGAEIFPHYTVIPSLPTDLHLNGYYVVSQIGFFAVALLATVLLTVSVMARLRERERQISTLLVSTQTVLSSLELADVLDRLAENAADALGVPAASIRLLDPSGEQLTMIASHGLSQTYLDKGQVELAQSPMDRDALVRGVVIVSDATVDPRVQYPKEIAEEGIRSMLVAGIVGKRPLGILRMYSPEPHCFGEEDINFLKAIAHQGAIAIENALAYEALQKAEEQRTQFVRIVTHELRAPVTGTQSLLRVLLNDLVGELTEQQKDIVLRLNKRMDSLLVLINDLLSLAASKAVELQQPLAPVPVQPVLKSAVEHNIYLAQEKHIAMNVDTPDKILAIAAGQDGLRRIFENVISNAVKYTPEGGEISVDVREDHTNVVITVADNGIGIPQDALDHLGEEFYRASNARQSGVIGTGLGLTASMQLVDYFRGQIRFESAVDGGTTVILEFPRLPDVHPHAKNA